MASRSLNRVILIGNLTRDPELKYTPAGTAVCTFGVATNRSWTTNDGQTKEETQYHRIVSWQKLAELCGKLLTKGKKVFLEGRLTYRTFTGRDGQQRSITEIVLDDFIVFGDGRRAAETVVEKPVETKASESEDKSSESDDKPSKTELPEEVPVAETETPKPREDITQENVSPDDIPF